MRSLFSCLCLTAVLLIPAPNIGAAVRAYEKTVDVTVGNATFQQPRYYLENEHARIAVVADPGGAIVEYVNKATGTNHVAGDVYIDSSGKSPVKRAGWGWKDYAYDKRSDPLDRRFFYRTYTVTIVKREDNAPMLRAVGETEEQRIERTMTLAPNSAQLTVDIRQTNISDKRRALWLRWHPQIFPSSDIYGDSSCVLSPGEGDIVRKIRVGWGWDHWFGTHDGYWLAMNFKTGEGLLNTFERDKVPIHFTWTQYAGRSSKKGAVTMEPFPEVVLKAPGESVEAKFAYLPLTPQTDPKLVPSGVLNDGEEAARMRRFLHRVMPQPNAAMLNSYTFAQSIQFHWQHRRRDRLVVRDWGFADCAVVGFPKRDVPMRIRMVGGFFANARELPSFPKAGARCGLNFNITITDESDRKLYRNTVFQPCEPGIPGLDRFDREVSVPMTGLPDGKYTLTVSAIDPVTRKPCHQHSTQVPLFDEQTEKAQAELKLSLEKPKENMFVHALRKQPAVSVADGRAVIPIGVEDASGVARNGFPVRLGVPLPEGIFPRDTPVSLNAPDGQPHPVATSVMNVWPDGSLKWLQVELAADCPANGHAFYKLTVGEHAHARDTRPLVAAETNDTVTLTTGPMQIRIPKNRAAIPGTVLIDSNNDGQFSNDEVVMLPSQDRDIWWQDDGSDQPYQFTLSGPNDDAVACGVVIESNSTESATVRITGWYMGERGDHQAMGEIRIQANQGRKDFRIWHQVTFTGSPWRARLKSYGLKLRLAPNKFADGAAYALDGQSLSVPSQSSLLQRSANVASVAGPNGTITETGRRASGAIRLTGAAGSVLLYHPNFWQMYPKKIDADGSTGQLTVHYWPQEGGLHSFAPEEEFWIPSSPSAEAAGTGAGRTDELIVDFSGTVPANQADAAYNEPVIACTPPAWVQTTQVLNNLYPYAPDRHPHVERYAEELTDFFQRNREFFQWYGHWNYGTIHNTYNVPLYQWLLVGRYANIGNEENIVQSPWLQYFRSGDRRYYKFAKVWTRHLMEVQSIRWHETYRDVIGMSRRHHQSPWLGNGDYGHTMLCPFLEYYHADGYRPAWEMAKRTARAMAHTYAGSWRYISNPIIGNTRMYLETGDPQYKEVADRIWQTLCAPDRNNWMKDSHGSRMGIWYSQINEECGRLWRKWTIDGRAKANGKVKYEFAYNDTYGAIGDETGNDRFAFQAMQNFDNSARATYSGQVFGLHPVYRGMPMTNTQHVIGFQRRSFYAAGQIAKARKLFPANFYNGPLEEVVVKSDGGGAFDVWIGCSAGDGALTFKGPDEQKAPTTVTTLYTPQPSITTVPLRKVTVRPNAGPGLYRMRLSRLRYLGCSEKNVAILTKNNIDFIGADPLYVRSNDLGAPGVTRILMRRTPADSLEIFAPNGKRLFSETTVRPANDLTARKHELSLPANTILKLGDKVGVEFPDLQTIPFYLNADGVFHIK